MNKVILKTALITIAGLALAALLVFSLWILISPQTMATSCEDTGNYSFAVTCADLRYKYTGKVDDLARCAQDSILSRNDGLIIKYGEKLVSDEGFDELCVRKDEQVAENLSGTDYAKYATSYKSFICGNLSVAQYRNGDMNKAVETAKKGGSFSMLALEIIQHGTKEQAETVKQEIGGSDENLTALLNKFINEGD